MLVVEALDRLSRDTLADLGQIHKIFTFLGIEIIEVNDGGRPADTVLIGLRGLVAQLFREDGAKKVRRGMLGLVSAGRHAEAEPTVIGLVQPVVASRRSSRMRPRSSNGFLLTIFRAKRLDKLLMR